MKSIWLREETNPHEKRAILIPAHAGILARNGYPIYIEHSTQRIFSDAEYENEGCTIVASGSWPDAPLNAYILGIKGLPIADFPLKHAHICLAYIYENEVGSQEMLERFHKGGGILFDLEYLIDFRGSQIVTKGAGYWAGICGAAISINLWCQKKLGLKPPYTILHAYQNYTQLIEDLIILLNETGNPNVLIIGAYGMTGTGARAILDKLDLNHRDWSRQETQKAGPFLEILDYDILLNCVVVKEGISIFLTPDSLLNNKKLSIIGDITCNPDSPHNPLPLYEEPTTFLTPSIRLVEGNMPIDLMSIDNLASLLPIESSQAMSEQLLPYLCELLMADKNYKNTPWERSIAEFYKRM